MNGCCNLNVPGMKQYCCDGCSSSGRCGAQEYCVSCCLQPDKQLLLERFFRRAAVAFQNLFMAVEDHFELCLAKCRTSSQVRSHDASGGGVGQWESTSGRKLENPHWGPFGGVIMENRFKWNFGGLIVQSSLGI